MKKISKILIANRGEIANRIIRTCKRVGIYSCTVYSEDDKDSLFTRLSDETFPLDGTGSQAYLNGEALVSLAKEEEIDAIHPGYGFLSENSEFAKLCERNGIIFIGPNSSAIDAMGDKARSKDLMMSHGVPVVPGYHGGDQSEEKFKNEAEKIGYPVLLKPSAGGGGKGMRLIHSKAEFSETLASAKREAVKSFGDDRMLLEKWVLDPRHIEVQVLGDQHGNLIHLYERDCSVQRRNQKIIEESPAPGLSDQERKSIGEVAVQAAKAVNYSNAGTVEFIYSEKTKDFYFMEMNTRLQVEHPVTEMVTGVDLVEEQIKVAEGKQLSFCQEDIKQTGHAFELRVYAEDPEESFFPTGGRVLVYREPKPSEGVRIDSAVEEGSEISLNYDPMISKLIVFGKTREAAIQNTLMALKRYVIFGFEHNLSFLTAIFSNSRFQSGSVTTSFLGEGLKGWTKPITVDGVSGIQLAGGFLLKASLNQKKEESSLSDEGGDTHDPYGRLSGWRLF